MNSLADVTSGDADVIEYAVIQPVENFGRCVAALPLEDRLEDVFHNYGLLLSWETRSELPRFSVALHGAAELLGVMLQEGVERQEVDAALGRLLDDIEQRISEDRVMGGPPRGNA